MQKFMYAFRNGSEITIDPNYVKISAAGTNMKVATYPNKHLNVGDRRAVYENFRELELSKENRKKMEEIFKQEKVKLEEARKSKEAALRSQKKNKKAAMVG